MNLKEIEDSARNELKAAVSREAVEKLRVKYLGRKGEITAVLRSLKDMPLEERRRVGPEAQSLRRDVERLINEKVSAIGSASSASGVDLTAPGRKVSRGHLHPLTLVDEEIRRIFKSMNFSVVEGPEVETEYYNFDALNIPPNHPAREMWDTFWLRQTRTDADGVHTHTKKSPRQSALLLRTHTSPMQIRYMEEHNPPFQIIVPGRTFRYEATDASHEINFYQLEGLMVGKSVSLANFKSVVQEFFKRFFGGQKIEFRYRPAYFPFVEPGLEVEIKLATSGPEKGLRPNGAGKRQGTWLEIMGAGMVHPRVFEFAHYNPRDWQGFAFGMGLDRLAMIKYKIPDIRLFYSGDLRFIRQF